MKPEAPTPILGSERVPAPHEVNVETQSDLTAQKPEFEAGFERKERVSETNAVVADVGLTTAIPTPVVVSTVTSDDTTITQANGPLVANDDDLIEKEWVDRAKKIVSETQNDPRQRDDRISSLKVDYVKKRFGRELGAAE